METKEKKIRRIKEETKIKCVHVICDGAGSYCGLKPMQNKDYPHKFLRTDCYGHKWNCRFEHLYQE